MSRIVKLDSWKILATKENIDDLLRYIDEVRLKGNFSNPVYLDKNKDIPDKITISTFIKNPMTKKENYIWMALEHIPEENYYEVRVDEDLKESCIDFINGFTAWKLYKYADENGLTYYTDVMQTENGYEVVIYFYQQ